MLYINRAYSLIVCISLLAVSGAKIVNLESDKVKVAESSMTRHRNSLVSIGCKNELTYVNKTYSLAVWIGRLVSGAKIVN